MTHDQNEPTVFFYCLLLDEDDINVFRNYTFKGTLQHFCPHRCSHPGPFITQRQVKLLLHLEVLIKTYVVYYKKIQIIIAFTTAQ